MALTRRLLEGMGIEDKQIETIIEAHSETVNGLKAERDKYKEDAAKVPDLQKELEAARKANEDAGGWEQKFNDEHKAFEDFKTKVDSEKAEARKAQAYRNMLKAADIDPRRIDAIMRVTDLSKVEMDGDALKDVDSLSESAKTEWADFVVKTKTQGAEPATPPKASGAIEGADPEVAKRMQARHERLYGKTQEG